MSAARVTFAEVLRDEYEYFHDPDPPREWTLQDSDVRELPALVEKVRTIKYTERAAAAVRPALCELANRAVAATKDGVLDALGGMVRETTLFTTLRTDGDIRAMLLDPEHPLLRRLATIPRARHVLFSDPQVAKRIVEDEALVDLFTSRSPELLLLTTTEGFREVVRLYPSLLSTVADSGGVQRYLDADGDAVQARANRKELVALFRNASTKMRAVRRSILGPRRKWVSEVDDRMQVLSRNAQALLETLPAARLKKIVEVAPDEAIERAALSQFNVLLLECAYGGHIADGHDLRDLYSRIHEKNVAALCLSGGGIRSATFNLGILQGLAEKKLLTQFHYLSTVSGGGYIGSWLSSWMRRHSEGPWGVAKDLCAKPEDPLAPEVRPIQHLREYSSYLAPRGSTMSVDTWTIVATYLRNLLLNWTMLIPALLAFLVVPRAVEMLVVAAMAYDRTHGIAEVAMFLGGAFASVAFGSVRPARDLQPGDDQKAEDRRDRAARFRWWLIPTLLGGTAFTAYWASLLNSSQQLVFGFNPLEWKLYALMFAGSSFAGAFVYSLRRVAASIGVLSPPSRPLRDWFRAWRKPAAMRPAGWSYAGVFKAILQAVRAFRADDWSRAVMSLFLHDGVRLFTELLAAVCSGALGGIVLFAIFKGVFPPESLDRLDGWPRLEVYVSVALPLFLAVFFLQASLLAGFTTGRSTDYDREWWARSSSWIFICGIVYLAIAGAVILAPIAIIEWKKIAASLGGGSAIAAWLLARGGRLAATPKEKDVVGAGRWRTVALRIAALSCLLFLVAILSLLTTGILGSSGAALDIVATTIASQNAVLGGTFLARAGEAIVRVLAYSTILQDWFELLKEQRVTLFSTSPSGDSLRWHFAVLRGSSELVIAVFVVLMLTIALVMSRLLNVNIYSMHGMYRNRLIRAYLGASRVKRRADPFTGFDPRDNLTMWQLRPEALWTSSFPDFDAFVRRFVEDGRSAKSGAPQPVLAQLPDHVRVRVLTYDAGVQARLAGAVVSNSLARADVEIELVDAINRMMLERDLRHDVAIPGSINSFRANRAFLDQRFAGVLAPCPSDRLSDRGGDPVRKVEKYKGRVVSSVPRQRKRPPLHVLNMALNLVAGRNLAWRERKADSFTVTPLHAGNKRLGYRDSVSYGDAISLGTAVAVSGAAVSPNHGYNSSPVVTFLMTLFNARLGWWLGNPGAAGEATYATAGPRKSIKSTLDEAFGRTTDTSDYVFLSDGGHFDNLGVYEMVLRRCRYIVVCDASEDHRYAFGDLANAVRKIRVDLGVDIRLKSMFIAPDEPDQPQKLGRYCALGCIDYDRVDVIDKHYPQKGFLIYIKPVVYADCPPDVRNYRKENAAFPHESTVDQFFSESQFESYRALGQHSVKQICESLQEKGKKKISDEEVRTIFQLFHGTAQYLEVAMKEQTEKDEAMTFFEKRQARRAAAAAATIESPGE